MNEAVRVILATIFGVVVVELFVYLLGQYIIDYYDLTNFSDLDNK